MYMITIIEVMLCCVQNTLSLLSRQIIQQFLDELVWRERWGPVASQAFDNIIAHMAEQTKLETGETVTRADISTSTQYPPIFN